MRHTATVVTGFVAFATLEMGAAVRPDGQQASLTVTRAIEFYADGDFSRAVENLNTQRLTVTPFTTALDEWIASGDPASAPHRKIIAAAFALDAIWSATRTADNANRTNADPWKKVTPNDPDRVLVTWYVSQPLVAQWAIKQLPGTGAPDPLERTLWLTAVAVVEDGHAWHQLRHDILPLARKRLPEEARFALADVLAGTNMDLGSLRLSATRRNDVLRVERLPGSVTGRIPKAIQALEPLLANPAIAGEVELRIGYLELRCNKWSAALTHLTLAHSMATERALRVAADYFAGWVHEQQDRPRDAVAAYRRAHALAPTVRNLATRLSALLFLGNERTEAYAILDRALNADSADLDPLLAVERADARFVPEWITSIRNSLR